MRPASAAKKKHSTIFGLRIASVKNGMIGRE
jgi:hypothetical protein